MQRKRRILIILCQSNHLATDIKLKNSDCNWVTYNSPKNTYNRIFFESEEILNFNFHLIAQSGKMMFFFNLDRVKSHTEFCYMIALQGK